MKQLIHATLSIGLVLSSVSSVEACCLWPFCGGWGAGYAPAYGYAPAPAYGYAANYPSWGTQSYGGYYSAGYASAVDCCAPSCCNTCGSGSCVSGSCGGSTSSGSGSLKPASDEKFKDGTTKDKYDDKEPALDSLDSPADGDLPVFERPSRSRTNPNPADDFGATPTDEKKSGADQPFESDGDSSRINNKPPMPDAKDLPAVEPTGEKTFLDGETAPAETQLQIEREQKSVAEQSSGLNEVIVPRRLASRSLPSPGSRNPTSWAGKSNGEKVPAVAPVRWISVPSPDGQVRL